MAQPDNTFQFKWKEPTRFTMQQIDFRSTQLRAFRRGIIEVAEFESRDPDVRINTDEIDEQWIVDLFDKEYLGPVLDPDGVENVGAVSNTLWSFNNRALNYIPFENRTEVLSLQTHVHPWLVLQNIQVVRDERAKHIFHMTCEWSTPGGIDPRDYYGTGVSFREPILIPKQVYDDADIPNSYPYIRRRYWGEEYKPVFEKKKAPTDPDQDGDRLSLPTGTRFAEPFMRRHPTKTFIQMQFEEITIPTDIEALIDQRLFAINGTEFAGNTPTQDGTSDSGQEGDVWAVPPRWMITDIQYELMRIPTDPDGDGTIVLADALLMIYTLEHSSADGGWFDRRGLVDRHFLESANDLTTKRVSTDPEDRTTIVDALLRPDGTLKTNQAGPSDYKDYELQPRISFDFLRDD